MPYIQDFSRNIAELGFLATLAGNSTLIFLTRSKTKHIRGPYKRMIIIFAFLGIAFSVVEMTARPFVHSYNGAFVYFSLAEEISGLQGIVTFLLALYAGLYAMLISFVAVQFIFRYFILNDHETAQMLFQGWKLMIWVIYASIFGVAWICLCFFCGKFDDYSMEYTREEMNEVYDMNITQTAGMIIVAYVILFLIVVLRFLFLMSQELLRWMSHYSVRTESY